MSNELTIEDKELIKEIEKKVDRLYKAMFPDEQPDNEGNANTLPDFGKHLAQTTPVNGEWKPEPMEIYWAIDDTFNAYKTVGSGAERVEAGNCFPTEKAATKAAQLIRETLKQL